MPDDRFKGFLGFGRQWLFWRREYPLFVNDGQEAVLRERTPNPEELALGWAEGEDDETGKPLIQLKGVPQDYRRTHFYVVGASGSGKSKFLETLAKQDMANGDGFGVI